MYPFLSCKCTHFYNFETAKGIETGAKTAHRKIRGRGRYPHIPFFFLAYRLANLGQKPVDQKGTAKFFDRKVH